MAGAILSIKQAWIAFGLLGLIWGSSFLFIRVSVEQLTPFQVVFIRTGIAAVGLTILAYAQGKRLPTHWAGIFPLLVLGVVTTVFPFVLITWGEQYIESGLAALLQSSAAFFTLIIAHFVFTDERITLKKIVGMVLGFFGVLVLASRSFSSEAPAEGTTQLAYLGGMLSIVAASLCYGIGGTYSRRVVQKHLDPIVTAAGTMGVAAIITGILSVISPYFGGPPPVMLADLRSDVLFSVVVLGLLNTFIAYIIFYTIIGVLGAARTSMVTYIVPMVGLVLGAIFLNETVDIRLVIGAVLIIGGIAVVNLRLNMLFNRPTAPQPEPAKDAA